MHIAGADIWTHGAVIIMNEASISFPRRIAFNTFRKPLYLIKAHIRGDLTPPKEKRIVRFDFVVWRIVLGKPFPHMNVVPCSYGMH